MTVWSYLSWAVPPLPALPSFFNLSLPPNIQKRFVSYLLKRSLGRFVKGGGLDVEKIEGQISEGTLKLEKLELDVEAVNEFLSSDLPLTVRSGQMYGTLVQIPFQNLWSDSLILEVSSIFLDININPTSSCNSSQSRPTHSHIHDLAASATSVAQEFLSSEVDAYEGADLARSIRQSLTVTPKSRDTHDDGDIDDPFVSPQSMDSDKVAPGGFPLSSGTTIGDAGSVPNSSVLAGLVERVLARLQVQVGEINIRMHAQDNEKGLGAAWFDLKVDRITYMTETDARDTTDHPMEGSSTSRVISWATVSLQVTEELVSGTAADQTEQSELRRNRRRSGSRTPTESFSSLRTLSPKPSNQGVRSDGDSSTSESDIDPAADMMMSQAIADLRESQDVPNVDVIPDMSVEGEALPGHMPPSPSDIDDDEQSESLYASAMEGTITGGESNSSSFAARTTTPIAGSSGMHDFVRSGSPARKPRHDSGVRTPDRLPSSPKDRTSTLFALSTESSIRMANGKQTNIRIHVGRCAAFVIPWQIPILFAVSRAFSAGDGMSSAEVEESPVEIAPPVSIEVQVPEIMVAVAQTLDSHGDAASTWVRDPYRSTGMDIVRLRISGLELLMHQPETSESSNIAPDLSLKVATITVEEELALSRKALETARILGFSRSSNVHSKENSVQSSTTNHATRQLWHPHDWPKISCRELLGLCWTKASDSPNLEIQGRGANQSPQKEEYDLKVSYMQDNNRWSIQFQPCIICLDVSLMDRLQPLLSIILGSDSRGSAANLKSPQSQALQTHPFEKATTTSQSHFAQSTTKRLIDSYFPSLRLVFRWPTRHQGEPAACIVLTHLRFSNASEEGLSVAGTFDQMLAMICPLNGTDCQTILAVGSLKEDQEDNPPPSEALLPHFRLRLSTINGFDVNLQVPSMQCNVDKASVEAIQYLVDDLSSWAARRRKSESTQGDTNPTSGLENGPGPISVRFRVTEVDVFMRTPPATSDMLCKRLVCSLSDSEMTVIAKQQQEIITTAVTLTINNATVAHCDGDKRAVLLQRQARQSPMSPSFPAIVARYSSSEDQLSSRKQIGVNCELVSMTFVATPSSCISDLACLFESPPGIFENVEPSEVTKLSVNLKDTLIIVPAHQVPGALMIRFDGLSAASELLANADRNTYNVAADSVELFASDQPLEYLHQIFEQLHIVNAAGDSNVDVCSVIASKNATLRVSICPPNLLAGNHIGLDVGTVAMAACADTFALLGRLIEDIASCWASSSEPPEEQSTRPSPLAKGSDLLASLDDAAFTRNAPVLSDVEVISDDIPTNEVYLKKYDSGGQARRRESITSSRKSVADLPQSSVSKSQDDSSQVRILYDGVVRLSPGYWTEQLPSSKLNERLQLSLDINVDEVRVLLHDGYDWSTTRKTIEAEIKNIRRRLYKFRQILASGQTPDESVEVTRTWLYESILIGLPEEELAEDAEALIAAIDNQLEHLEADTASIAPSGPATTKRGDSSRSSPRPAKRRRKLERSSRPEIEIKLGGLQVLHRIAVAGVRDRAKTSISLVNLEILDHIKTSTWKKFLAPMALARGQVAEADVKMIQVLLTKVIAEQNDKQQEEYRLKVEVQPLRLHIDQDALEFIKRFFSFQSVATAVDASPTSPSKESAYLQHVEILPVHIKMDYKPKRVSVRALRAGKTMELMNFFHFDGSEMTLRRVLLSGVTGWSTLYDALNDIWAPDVKSNQLADVLAGVTPLRSVVTVGSGVADLILLPVENYRQDGRVSRGLQKGAKSFAMTTALEALRLGAHLATGTQVILEKAEHALGGKFEDTFPGGDFSNEGSDGEQSIMVAPMSKYAQQPESFKEGLSAAYQSLSSNFTQAAQTILAVPMEVHERSENGTVRAVVRAIPVAILKSSIGATEAVSKALFGIRNQLDPSLTAELSDKYK